MLDAGAHTAADAGAHASADSWPDTAADDGSDTPADDGADARSDRHSHDLAHAGADPNLDARADTTAVTDARRDADAAPDGLPGPIVRQPRVDIPARQPGCHTRSGNVARRGRSDFLAGAAGRRSRHGISRFGHPGGLRRGRFGPGGLELGWCDPGHVRFGRLDPWGRKLERDERHDCERRRVGW